jgi:hypothetical protein
MGAPALLVCHDGFFRLVSVQLGHGVKVHQERSTARKDACMHQNPRVARVVEYVRTSGRRVHRCMQHATEVHGGLPVDGLAGPLHRQLLPGSDNWPSLLQE